MVWRRCRLFAFLVTVLSAANLADARELRDQMVAPISEPPAAAPAISRPRALPAKKPAAKPEKKMDKKTDTPAKHARAWTLGRETGSPTLKFGSPGNVVLSFSCQPETGMVRVIAHLGGRGLRPGDGAYLRLTSGRARFEVAGTAFAAEADNTIDIGGITRIDAKLFDLLRAGDTMLVDVPGRKMGLPVRGLETSADAFEKACAARR